MALEKQELQARGIYRLASRNLDYGVYDGEGAFIGIREKFGRYYLDTEHLHDEAARLRGTARPLEYVGELPAEIPLGETAGSTDRISGRPVAIDRTSYKVGARWYFLDTGERSTEIFAMSEPNEALFAFLETLEQEQRE